VNFKSYKSYTLNNDAHLNDLFTDLPSNAFINKGWCGNGATTLELTNYRRSSIVIVPNIFIVQDKWEQYPNAQMIYGDITLIEVQAYLIKKKIGQKIISTPEGIVKIMGAASECGMVQDLYNDWFLMLDEGHSYISEFYREDILAPFDHFYRFKNKCIVSATPYYFTDPRMAELDHIQITPTHSLGIVNLLEAVNVNGTLKAFIDDSVFTGDRLFIFYNSVREIVNLIKACDLTDCHIYCADDDEGKNMKTMGDYSYMHRSRPKTHQFAIINFITTVGFEGWDLVTESATMIVATDIRKPHTTVGIDKCFQALGRWRKPKGLTSPRPKIYHVYNHRNEEAYREMSRFISHYQAEGQRLIANYRKGASVAVANGMNPTLDLSLKRYARHPNSLEPVLDYNLLDQVINEEYNKEVYNHKSRIQRAWEDYKYETNHVKRYDRMPNARADARESKAEKLKRDYKAIMAYNDDGNVFKIGSDPTDKLQYTNPLAVDASKYLTLKAMEALQYNIKKVEAEVIKIKEPLMKVKLMKLINLSFILHKPYTYQYLKETLQGLYDQLRIKDSNGKPRKATAQHIKLFYEVEPPYKETDKDGSRNWVMKLIRPTFQMVTSN
jgi:hypothetical protein